MTKPAILDRFDSALLAAVQQDNLTPARVLAERVGLSESAVLRRLRRMRQEGIILADVSVVSPEVLGLPVTLHVLVSLERETSAGLDAFVKTLRSRSEVVAAWYVTGDADYLLQLRLPDMASYEYFSRTVLQDDPNVRIFRTMVSMRQVVGAKTVQSLLPPSA